MGTLKEHLGGKQPTNRAWDKNEIGDCPSLVGKPDSQAGSHKMGYITSSVHQT